MGLEKQDRRKQDRRKQDWRKQDQRKQGWDRRKQDQRKQDRRKQGWRKCWRRRDCRSGTVGTVRSVLEGGAGLELI